MFKKSGTRINVGRRAMIGNGGTIEIGSHSGIGRNCFVNNVKIGNFGSNDGTRCINVWCQSQF